MNNSQLSKRSMFLTLRASQPGYDPITKTLPFYNDNLAVFYSAVDHIDLEAEQQKVSKKGVTQQKNDLKQQLIEITADYSRKLGAFSLFTNNSKLQQEINFTKTYLQQRASVEIRDYARIVYDRAQANISVISSYGINADSQASLLALINTYTETLVKPRISRAESSQATQNIDHWFKVAEDALKKMDKAVEIVRLSQPAFYASYKNSRRIYNKSYGTHVLRGLVTDSVTGEPIKGVTIDPMPVDAKKLAVTGVNGSSPYIKKTALKGRFYYKSIPAGLYTVKAYKVGYADQEASVAITDGDCTNLNINLDPQ